MAGHRLGGRIDLVDRFRPAFQGDQRTRSFEAFEGDPLLVAKTHVDLHRTARGIECLCRFAHVIQQGGIAAKRRRQGSRIEFQFRRLDGTFQVVACGLRVFDLPIEQADIAVRHVDAIPGAEALADFECLQLLIHGF